MFVLCAMIKKLLWSTISWFYVYYQSKYKLFIICLVMNGFFLK
ncbi:hypothetical protein [Staphylococcus phage phiSa2wa-st1420]|nr:hypothetical protein [Staphylococcus phage phiSa2wa-st1420]